MANESRIKLPGGVYDNVGDISSVFQTLSTVGSSERIIIEIPESGIITPLAITTFTAAAIRWILQGREVAVTCSVEKDPVRYLQRMDFFRVAGIEIPESFVRHDSNKNFLTVSLISNKTDLDNISNELSQIFAKTETNILDMANYCLGEILNNSRQHSNDIGFACAQFFPLYGILRISITDVGIGIRKSFEGSKHEAATIDDKSAISFAVQKNTSSKSTVRHGPYDFETNTGNGLYFLRRIVEETKGNLFIASGQTVSCFNPAGRSFLAIDSWQGTSVSISVRRNISNWLEIKSKIQREIVSG
jgi:hypothetical protein